ncbi:hypothetical protein [Inhella proteolytica]|uniref:Uncharacterized protein n=1 Tax=Inhella proteolytica TaxID=2795029 RepID=A0A931NIV2_9BURK|nr:hypothetical protein [Inhella proteolytica]MBH9579736.1 hypothetical protein [Inhella proteolytica]
MKRVIATAISAVGASFAPATIFILVLALTDPYLTIRNAIFYFVCAAVVSAAHVIFLGLPICVALQRAGRFNKTSVVSAGFAVGALPILLLFAIQAAQQSKELSLFPAFATTGIGGLLGAASAGCFYCVLVTLRRTCT